jgi:hypothetical protein
MRDIDSKFAIDDNGKIFKKSNGEIVPEDEPLFLLRARDVLALPLLLKYRKLSEEDGCNDYHFENLDATIAKFEKFAREHPERMKQPSKTRGL